MKQICMKRYLHISKQPLDVSVKSLNVCIMPTLDVVADSGEVYGFRHQLVEVGVTAT
jgi:hypothetical protein